MRSPDRVRLLHGFLMLVLPLTVVLAPTAEASLVLDSPQVTSGTGIGTVNTILTVNNTPTESGCVAWDGSADVVGPAACPVGIAGGDEQTGESQTQTRTMAELGLTTAAGLRIVFNAAENESDAITVENLVLTIYSPAGAELFNSGPFVPVTFPNTFTGVGNSGFVFRLDEAQAAAAEPFFASENRIGLAASLSGTDAGNETFFVADFGGLEVTVTQIPTVSSVGLVLLALLLAGAGVWVVVRRG